MKRNELIIEPSKGLLSVDWGELWRYRELFIVLTWRDLAVRYKQTYLGVAWALFQPLVTMILFSVIFHGMAKIESGDGTPYPIFVFVGLLLWHYYSNTLSSVSMSMINNTNLIQKIYFPRLILPASNAIIGLVDFGISCVVLAGMMVYYGYYPSLLGLAMLPVLLLLAVASSLGLGLFLAAVNIKYRDVRYILPFFIQTLMFVTPVIYPVSMLENHPILKTALIWLNPMTGIIANARAGLLGSGVMDWGLLGISALTSLVLLVLGIAVFRNTERYFADIA